MSRAGLPARDERDEPSREISPADSVGTSSRTVSHGARVLDASRPERRARRREKNANRTRAARDCRRHDDDGRARRDDGRGADPRRRGQGYGCRRTARRFRHGGDHPRDISQGCRHRRRVSEALHARDNRRDVPVARGGGPVARRGRVPRQSLVEHTRGLPRDVLRRCEPWFSASRCPRARPSVEGRGARNLPRFRFFPRKKSPFAESPRLEPLEPPAFSPRRDVPRGFLPERARNRRANDAPSGRRSLAPSRYPLARASARPCLASASRKNATHVRFFPRQLESSVDAIFCHVEVSRTIVFVRPGPRRRRPMSTPAEAEPALSLHSRLLLRIAD